MESKLEKLKMSFDDILTELNKQGQIEEEMLYVNRGLAEAFARFMKSIQDET